MQYFVSYITQRVKIHDFARPPIFRELGGKGYSQGICQGGTFPRVAFAT